MECGAIADERWSHAQRLSAPVGGFVQWWAWAVGSSKAKMRRNKLAGDELVCRHSVAQGIR